MKKVFKCLLVLLMFGMISGCSKKENTFTSTQLKDIILANISEETSFPIMGRNDKNEIVNLFNPYPFVIDDSNRDYYTSEGFIIYFKEKYNVSIEESRKSEIMNEAMQKVTDETTNKEKVGYDAFINELAKLANVTLDDALYKEIQDKALADAVEEQKTREAERLVLDLEFAGLNESDFEEFVFSTTMINTKAYGIGIFKPVDGQKDAVIKSCENFVENTRKSFESYLQDQLKFAEEAKIAVLDNGYVVMVMCEDSEKIFNEISTALTK